VCSPLFCETRYALRTLDVVHSNVMRALDSLAAMKGQFGPAAARTSAALLTHFETARLRYPADLIRLHETVLFLRAYPQSARVLRLADHILFSFPDRLGRMNRDVFEDPEVSGIAGTGLSTNFSYEIAKSLVRRHSRAISIDWENYEHSDRLGVVLSKLVPQSREDFGISAHPDAHRWFSSLKGGLGTLLDRAEPRIYDLLEVPLRWELGDSAASRSRTRLPTSLGGREIFYHHRPLLKRSEVSIQAEFAAPKIAVTKLSRAQSEKILSLIVDTSSVRYRELYGFTHPDVAHVRHADLGRGMDFFFFGVAPNSRLIRDYHAGMYFKNGVPIGYVELLSKDGTMEVGFNLYYTFRDAETAWLYARLLKIFRERLGAKRFWIDPYQIGHENDEALDSGAFWFYRKLGFRSVSTEIAKLIEREESRIAATPGYRTPATILRRLARAALIYD
jgi:hypothetical protein